MNSSGGMSLNSSGLRNSGSDEELQLLMDQRKRKRMMSNRESARRSRLRKQQHLDELMAVAVRLREENRQILTGLNLTTQQFLNVESENAILRARGAELSHRLQSLNEIVSFLSAGNGGFPAGDEPAYGEVDEMSGFPSCSWNCFNEPFVMTAASAAAVAGFLTH